MTSIGIYESTTSTDFGGGVATEPILGVKKVFVSGCYDIIHAGHIRFFETARSLGDHLTVCFASAEVLRLAKNRNPSLPDDHKRYILSALRYVDSVVTSSDLDPIFDFRSHITHLEPHILAVTDDDKNIALKQKFCDKNGIQLVVLPKESALSPLSTTIIISTIKNS